MADDFPDSYETKTTTTTTTTSSTTVCTYNAAYPMSIDGILRIAQIVVALIYWICVAVGYVPISGAGFIIFTSISSWIFTIIIFVLILFMFTERITIINWPLTEFLNNVIWGLLHFIGVILMIVTIFQRFSKPASVWFAFILSFVITGLYLFHAFLGFKRGVVSFRAQSSGATVQT